MSIVSLLIEVIWFCLHLKKNYTNLVILFPITLRLQNSIPGKILWIDFIKKMIEGEIIENTQKLDMEEA